MLLANAGHNPFVADLTVVLVVAAATSVLFRRLRQSSVLGYLLAGLIVGPYIPIPLFADPGRIASLAEFGVILVMFSVGIEFSLGRLMQLLLQTGFTAVVQMASMACLGIAFGGAIGLDSLERVFLGCSLAISSTMVVSKVYDEYGSERQVRDLVFGILVIQDIAAVVFIAVLTAAARGLSITADGLGSMMLEVLGVLIMMIVCGLFVVPRLIRIVGKVGSREHMVVSIAALAFGVAWLAQSLGYSVALGAFLAGMLASESGRVEHIDDVVTPIRDLFAAVFFVSVGMSVDPAAALAGLPVAIPLALLVVLTQLIVVSGASVLSGNGLRRSLLAGASLGQIGEFAFIMIGVGTAAGVVSPALHPMVVTIAVVTTFTTSIIYRFAGRIALVIDHHMPQQLQASLSLYESWLERLRSQGLAQTVKSRLRRRLWVVLLDGIVVISLVVLEARFAEDLVRRLNSLGPFSPSVIKVIPTGLVFVLALPFVVSALRNAKRIGQELAESLMPSPEKHKLDLGRAPRRLVTVMFQLLVITGFGMPLLTIVQPFLPAFVLVPLLILTVALMSIYFWRTAHDLSGHVRAASEVVLSVLQAQTGTANKVGQPVESPDLGTLLPGFASMTSLRVERDSAVVGKALDALELSSRTGAAILAIHRPGNDVVSPNPETKLEVGDMVGVVGTEESVELARQLFTAIASTSSESLNQKARADEVISAN